MKLATNVYKWNYANFLNNLVYIFNKNTNNSVTDPELFIRMGPLTDIREDEHPSVIPNIINKIFPTKGERGRAPQDLPKDFIKPIIS